MASEAIAVTRTQSAVDRRIWWVVAIIGLFAVIVMKEVSMPTYMLATVAGVGFLGLFMIGIQSPEIPLYVLVAYLPFSRVMVGHFGVDATAFNTTNILMAWVFLGYAVHQISKHRPLFGGAPLSKLIWFFCLLGAASLVRAGWQYGSWYVTELILSLKRWLTPMLCYFLTLWVVREKRPLKAIVVLMMMTVAVVGAMASWDYLTTSGSSNLEHARVGGIAENPNTLGAFFNYYMFLIFGFFLIYAKKFRAWLLLIPLLICFRGVMVTFSRGAYLGFAAGLLTACFVRKKPLFVAAVMVLAFAVINPWMLPKGIQFRMGMTMKQGPSDFIDEPLEETLESSAANRIVIWKGALQMIKDHPWWGVGYGAFPSFIGYYTSGAEQYRDAHNSYLLIASEMGIPTLVVFLIIVLVAGYYTWWLYAHTEDRFFKATALGVLAGLGGLVVANMFGSRMDAQETTSYFWILCALIMRAILIQRQEIRDKRQASRKTASMIGRRTVRTQPV